MFKKILGGICCFLAVGGAIGFISGTGTQSPISTIVLVAFFAIASILLFSSDKRKAKKEAKRTERSIKNAEKLKTCKMKHVNGLPIAEGVDCNITALDDKFVFSSGAMNFELEKSKITDMCIKTDKEIQQQYVSSVGGAIGGAVLFGPLGAMIGGRAKKKNVKNIIHNYLIITYQSPDIKYIGFEIGNSLASAYSYVDVYKNSVAADKTYQL